MSTCFVHTVNWNAFYSLHFFMYNTLIHVGTGPTPAMIFQCLDLCAKVLSLESTSPLKSKGICCSRLWLALLSHNSEYLQKKLRNSNPFSTKVQCAGLFTHILTYRCNLSDLLKYIHKIDMCVITFCVHLNYSHILLVESFDCG